MKIRGNFKEIYLGAHRETTPLWWPRCMTALHLRVDVRKMRVAPRHFHVGWVSLAKVRASAKVRAVTSLC